MKAITPDVHKDETSSAQPASLVDGQTTRQPPASSDDTSASAPASSLAKDMIDRQGDYSPDAKPSRKRGIVLVCLGIAMLICAGAFFASSLLSQSSTIKMTQLSQYAVPDGMLQEGAMDTATDVIYIYDLSPEDAPYAIESHAIIDGLFGTTDLYEQWDGEKMFEQEREGNTISGDVSNYRKIVIHLPSEAKGYVAGDSASGAASK